MDFFSLSELFIGEAFINMLYDIYTYAQQGKCGYAGVFMFNFPELSIRQQRRKFIMR